MFNKKRNLQENAILGFLALAFMAVVIIAGTVINAVRSEKSK
jgi:hypothetical protein